MAQFDSAPVGGRTMRIYVGTPDGNGPHPAVLLAFHREGFSSFTMDVVDQFTAAGDLIAGPDLFHRCGKAAPEEALKHRRDDNVLANMAAGLRYLKARPDVDEGANRPRRSLHGWACGLSRCGYDAGRFQGVLGLLQRRAVQAVGRFSPTVGVSEEYWLSGRRLLRQ